MSGLRSASNGLAPEQVPYFFVVIVFKRVDQFLRFPAFLVAQEGGGVLDPVFPEEKLLRGVVRFPVIIGVGQVA